MLINVEKLDKTKTYVALEIGNSLTAKAIQALSHKIYPRIPLEHTASHAFILRYNCEWKVVENHLKWKGVKAYPLSEYEKDNIGSDVKYVMVFEHNFNNDAINYYSSEFGNPGYSIQDLAATASNDLFHFKLPDSNGADCSALLCLCDNFEICYYFQKKASFVAPVDIQIFMDLKMEENINV